jgi:hypothetical protein
MTVDSLALIFASRELCHAHSLVCSSELIQDVEAIIATQNPAESWQICRHGRLH